MKTKRNKANRRTMQIYNSIFKFREPYQVLFDADFMIKVATQKMDVENRLAAVLGGTVKPMITQCSIAHLIKLATERNQAAQSAVDLARKICERRKCNHWKTKDSSVECVKGILGKNDNPLRYMICSQDPNFRTYLRENIVGVPVLYINRSGLLLLEDEGPASEIRRKELEEKKLHVPQEEIKLLEASTSQLESNAPTQLVNRPDPSNSKEECTIPGGFTTTSAQRLVNKLSKKKHRKGNPNPLSVKKKKATSTITKKNRNTKAQPNILNAEAINKSTKTAKRKRKKKKSNQNQASNEDSQAT